MLVAFNSIEHVRREDVEIFGHVNLAHQSAWLTGESDFDGGRISAITSSRDMTTKKVP